MSLFYLPHRGVSESNSKFSPSADSYLLTSFLTPLSFVHSVLAVPFFFLIFMSHQMACEILVPQLGIEPMPPVLAAQNLNLWIIRKFPQ